MIDIACALTHLSRYHTQSQPLWINVYRYDAGNIDILVVTWLVLSDSGDVNKIKGEFNQACLRQKINPWVESNPSQPLLGGIPIL